jgi:hypothetical protein
MLSTTFPPGHPLPCPFPAVAPPRLVSARGEWPARAWPLDVADGEGLGEAEAEGLGEEADGEALGELANGSAAERALGFEP